MYQLLIADDEITIREGLTNFIDWGNMDCELAYVAVDGIDAISYLESNRMDIIITDIRMPGKNGLELAHYVQEHTPETKIIILSGYSDFKYAQEALRQGAFDFILKNNPLTKIKQAVERAIDDIRRKREDQLQIENIRESFDRTKEELRIKFYLDLIHDVPFSAEGLKEKISLYGTGSRRIYCILIKIRITDTSYRVKTEFINSLTSYLKTVFSPVNPSIFPIQSHILCMILNDASNLEKSPLQSTFQQLYTFTENDPMYQLQVAVSNVHTCISKLNTAYLECCYCLKHHVKTKKKILFYSNEGIHAVEDAASGRPLIKNVIRFIENNYNEQIMLPVIAEAVGLNASYLSRLFKKETGSSVTEYLTNYRIDRSKELLRDPVMRLRDIAEAVGFNDVSYYSNTFKKTVGISPTEFRSVSKLF